MRVSDQQFVIAHPSGPGIIFHSSDGLMRYDILLLLGLYSLTDYYCGIIQFGLPLQCIVRGTSNLFLYLYLSENHRIAAYENTNSPRPYNSDQQSNQCTKFDDHSPCDV